MGRVISNDNNCSLSVSSPRKSCTKGSPQGLYSVLFHSLHFLVETRLTRSHAHTHSHKHTDGAETRSHGRTWVSSLRKCFEFEKIESLTESEQHSRAIRDTSSLSVQYTSSLLFAVPIHTSRRDSSSILVYSIVLVLTTCQNSLIIE